MCSLQETGRSLDDENVALRGALKRLYELLETHAPMWYAEADRNAAEEALGCRI